MVLAGICFIGIAIVNLGMPVDDLLIQLVAIVLLVVALIAIALVTAFIIRYLLNRKTGSEEEEFEAKEELEDSDNLDKSSNRD